MSTDAQIVEQIKDAPIYFSHQGDVLLQYGHTNIIKSIDLKKVDRRISELRFELSSTNRYLIEHGADSASVSNFNSSISASIDDLDHGVRQLFNAVGLNKKYKRGVINGIGSGFKFLFGTMDSNDQEEIKAAVERLSNNNQNLAARSVKTLSIIRELNQANLVLKRNQDNERIKVDQIIRYINKMEARRPGNSTIGKIDELRSSFANLIFQFRLEIAGLHDGFLFFRAGVLDTFILDRDEISTAINNRNLGYNLQPYQVDQLLATCNRSIYTDKDTDVVYLTFSAPIAHPQDFALYEMYKLPTKANGTDVTIKQIARYMIIDRNQTEFWIGDTFTQHRVNDNTTIVQVPLLRETRVNACCELDVFMSKSDAGCILDLSFQPRDEEIAISDGLLMFSRVERYVGMECQDTKRKLMKVSKTTIITGINGCNIWGENFKIEKQIQLPPINLFDVIGRVNCCIWNNQPNISDSTLPVLTPLKLDQVNDETSMIEDTFTWIQENKLEKEAIVTVISVPSVVMIILIFGIMWTIKQIRFLRGKALIDKEWKRTVAQP